MKRITVGLVGAPNVGKSSLLNKLINKKVSIVSDKPHTTRNKVIGIRNKDDTQIIFIDTPGISNTNKKSALDLAKVGEQVSKDVDLVIFVFDINISPQIISLKNIKNKIAIVNKVDKWGLNKLLMMGEKLKSFVNTVFYTSAITNKGVEDVIDYICTNAPEQEWMFDEDCCTTQTHEELLSELTREVVFEKFHDELPYKVKVESVLDAFTINQKVICPKAHKHIYLSKIKEISMCARKKAQESLNKKFKLYLEFVFI